MSSAAASTACEQYARLFTFFDFEGRRSYLSNASSPPRQIVLLDFGEVIEVIFHDDSTRFSGLRRGPRFRIGIQRLGRRLCRFRRGFAAEGLVPIPDDAQPLEGEKFVHFFNEM